MHTENLGSTREGREWRMAGVVRGAGRADIGRFRSAVTCVSTVYVRVCVYIYIPYIPPRYICTPHTSDSYHPRMIPHSRGSVGVQCQIPDGQPRPCTRLHACFSGTQYLGSYNVYKGCCRLTGMVFLKKKKRKKTRYDRDASRMPCVRLGPDHFLCCFIYIFKFLIFILVIF